MAASVHDNAVLSGLFDAGEASRLFTSSAEIRAMLVVEGALAKAQGAAGVIPETSAAAIHRAAMEVQLDPGSLAATTAQNGVVVPALVAAFREAMQAPEHAQYVHWGATSQDIIDTGLMLRLRQSVALISADAKAALSALSTLADTHADTIMVARTYGQQGAPTTFGAVVATWGWPLLTAYNALQNLEFPASLSGAVGTGSVLGPNPAAIRADMAKALDLADPGRSWHTDRTPLIKILTATTQIAEAFGKLGEDAVAMTQTEVGELNLGTSGASSTMPQKQNPVGPSALVALANAARGFEMMARNASTHRFQRDGAAWFTEWMVVPQIILSAASSAKRGAELAATMTPNTEAMTAKLAGDGLLMSEKLSFALADRMPRPDAQAAVKKLAAQVRETGRSLSELAGEAWPDLPGGILAPANAVGTAPQDARAFAKAVRAL